MDERREAGIAEALERNKMVTRTAELAEVARSKLMETAKAKATEAEKRAIEAEERLRVAQDTLKATEAAQRSAESASEMKRSKKPTEC